MSIIPLDVQRRCEQRWAVRFAKGTHQGETKRDSDCHPSGFEQHHSTPSPEPHEDRKKQCRESGD